MLDLDGDAVDNHDMLKLPIHGLASGAFTRACLALMAAWLIQMSLAQEKPVPPDRKAAGWKSLFDGKTMEGWKVTDFAGHGDARVRDHHHHHHGEARSGRVDDGDARDRDHHHLHGEARSGQVDIHLDDHENPIDHHAGHANNHTPPPATPPTPPQHPPLPKPQTAHLPNRQK